MLPNGGSSSQETSECQYSPAMRLELASAWMGRIRHLDRGHRLVDQLADARLLGVGLKVRPARLLRHPEHILGQIPLVGVLAGWRSA
jgi:hypothetical protein